MPYKECWDYQQSLFNELLAKQGDGSEHTGTIIFVEHPAVYTLGKSGNMSNMLIDEVLIRNDTYCDSERSFIILTAAAT